jgi:formylmethanofuran dehydrogenase subunit D
LDDVLKKINYTSLSDQNSVQLFRKSVAERQKELIEAQLRDLEQTALTTGSATSEEALIRKQESALILDFIKRAKEVEPKGQVVLNDGTDYSRLILEEGDKIYIPSKTNTVIVQGEVMLPGAQSYVPNLTFDDYISSSGGFNFRANKENVLIIHPNGKAEIYDASFGMLTEPNINPGDSILILGKVDSKDLQIVKDITQILYQIAVGAAVIIKAY